MGSEHVGLAVYKVKLDYGDMPEQLGKVNAILQGAMTTMGQATSSGKQGVSSLTEGMAQLTLGINAAQQAFNGLKSAASVIGDLTDSYNSYQASMNGVASVARATGNSVQESMQVVKDSTAGGLLSQSDAAAAVKNLEAYGYSVSQAAEMIKVMTDAAVYNRQANYSVSEAVRVTTEGIRMENSVLSDASGINKNIAKMQEEYAAKLGVTTSDLTQAQKAQAVYNGILAEGGMYLGDAEGYTNTLAGAQSQLGTAVNTTKATLGELFDGMAPIIGGLADWISHNQVAIAGIVGFVGVIGAAGGLIAMILMAKKAITAFNQAMTIMHITSAAAKAGVVGVVLALGAIGAAAAAGAVIANLSEGEEEMADASAKANANLGDQAQISKKTADKIAKLNQQINKLTRDYNRSLKEIAVKHEENLANLNKQIQEANIDYRRSIDERNAEFSVSLAKQERDHQKTMDALTGQLNFLQRYNNNYNRQKLLQVQMAIAQEERLYKQETEKQQAEIDLQNAADKAKLDEKLARLQQELSEETAFMDKHREQLNSVRGEILLDEVESLNERYEEQKIDYTRQLDLAKTSGAQIGDGLVSAVDEALKNNNLGTTGEDMGKEFISGLAKGVKQQLDEFWAWVGQGGPIMELWKLILGEDKFNKLVRRGSSSQGGSGWASGGYTGQGNPNEIAGVVHRGEYVIPASQVDQSTGEPKIAGTTQNITINLSGTFATSATERRRVAEQIASALSQVQQARLS